MFNKYRIQKKGNKNRFKSTKANNTVEEKEKNETVIEMVEGRPYNTL